MFRFSIRDLLWLMLVVAIGSIWWADHRALSHQSAVMKNEQNALIRATIEKGFFPRRENDGTFTLISIDQILP
jgi:hypothetical protein